MLCISTFEEKISIMIGVAKNLNEKIKANEIIKDAVAIAGGNGGGGQPWFAMGGASVKTENLDEIFSKIINVVEEKIK